MICTMADKCEQAWISFFFFFFFFNFFFFFFMQLMSWLRFVAELELKTRYIVPKFGIFHMYLSILVNTAGGKSGTPPVRLFPYK